MARRLALLALLAALPLQACDDAPVKIGYLASLSGRGADLGEAGRNGVMLAVEAHNASGRAPRVDLLIGDDRHDEAEARKAARELASAGAVAIVGPITSQMANALVPIAEETRTVLISPTVSSYAFVGKDDHFFRINNSTKEYALAYADFHFGRKGVRRVALTYDARNAVFSESWASLFRGRFEELGGRVLRTVAFGAVGEIDFGALVRALLQKEPDGAAPDAVVIVATSLDAARIAQQVRKENAAIILTAAEWAAPDQLVQLAGRGADGLLSIESYDRFDASPRYAAFRQRYAERFRAEPNYVSVSAFDAAQVILAALAGRKDASQPLKEAILALRVFEGLQQRIEFDAFGDTRRRMAHVVVTQGAIRASGD